MISNFEILNFTISTIKVIEKLGAYKLGYCYENRLRWDRLCFKDIGTDDIDRLVIFLKLNLIGRNCILGHA